VVAATGPSLTPDVADACRGQNIIAVNDAYRLLPFAQMLYACDAKWWEVHKGCPDFQGEKWSSHGLPGRVRHNDKTEVAARYGLHLVAGQDGEEFSLDPEVITYGSNSGFQAINLALLLGAKRIVLVGFNMQAVNGSRHFFGDHGRGLRNTSSYSNFIRAFERAARKLPPEIQIVNATPNTALRCFRMMPLEKALDWLEQNEHSLPASA
jgi:hypothetical protein